MKILQYDSEKAYQDAQIKMGSQGFAENANWASPVILQGVVDYLKQQTTVPKLGLCHGVRRGRELEFFRKHLQCITLGTDLVPAAHAVEGVFVCDFHYVKPEWLGKFDFYLQQFLGPLQ